MIFEEEIAWMLPQGFWIVMAVYAIGLIVCYLKSKNRQLVWFVGQWLSLVTAFYCFCEWILSRPPEVEVVIVFDGRQCVFIVLTGLVWALSMAFFLRGICGILKNKNEGR